MRSAKRANAETLTVDGVNRRVWGDAAVVGYFAALDAWSEDAGEAVLLDRIAAEMQGEPVLDLGVGGGRTVPALRAMSTDYLGIDYMSDMVAAASARFPDVRFELGDARDLSQFADGSFGLVFFSFNGIDAVSHDDRRSVLREARRVLRPGGIFGFSTHNVDHRNAGKAPWDPRQVWPRDLRRVVRRFRRFPQAIVGHLRNRAYTVRGDGWAMLNSPAHDFGIVIHHISLPHQVEELALAGFDELEVYGMSGERIEPNGPVSATKWFHILARTPL